MSRQTHTVLCVFTLCTLWDFRFSWWQVWIYIPEGYHLHLCTLFKRCIKGLYDGVCSVVQNSLELLHPVFLYILCDPSLRPELPVACRQQMWMLLLKTTLSYETKDFLLEILSWLPVSKFVLLEILLHDTKGYWLKHFKH
jgi:hypothetical protein